MNRNLKDLKDAFNSTRGLLKDIENLVDVDELLRLGYISISVSPSGETWKLTKSGRSVLKFYTGEPSIYEKISDLFYKYILGFNVSV